MRRCFSRVLLKTNFVGKESPRCLPLSADRARTSSGTLKAVLLSEASALLGCDAEPFFEVSIERAVLLFGCFAGCVEIPRLSGQESKQRFIAFLQQMQMLDILRNTTKLLTCEDIRSQIVFHDRLGWHAKRMQDEQTRQTGSILPF